MDVVAEAMRWGYIIAVMGLGALIVCNLMKEGRK